MRAVVLVLLLAACKREEEKLTTETACDKLMSLEGDAGKRKGERERCIGDYNAQSAPLRTCTDACVKQATDMKQFDDCRDKCGAPTIPVFLMCSRVSFEKTTFDACKTKFEALQKDHPDQYGCWASCVRKAKEGSPEAAACQATCKIP